MNSAVNSEDERLARKRPSASAIIRLRLDDCSESSPIRVTTIYGYYLAYY